MGYSSLARVLTGWTGSIAFTQGGTTTTVTPFTRDSVASLIARLMHDVYVTRGYTITCEVSSGGVITLATSVAFDLTLASNVSTRTGFTGSYTGAATYTAAGAFTGPYVPAYGLRLSGPLLETTRGDVVGDGSGVVCPMRGGASGSLVAWDDEIATPDTSYEYDLWHDGRLQGRFFARSVKRVPLSRFIRSTTTTRVEIDVLEVA